MKANTVFCIDCSASISTEKLEKAKSYVLSHGDKLDTVIFFDSHIQWASTVSALDRYKTSLIFRPSAGGTDFTEVFKFLPYVNPTRVVIISDGYFGHANELRDWGFEFVEV